MPGRRVRRKDRAERTDLCKRVSGGYIDRKHLLDSRNPRVAQRDKGKEAIRRQSLCDKESGPFTLNRRDRSDCLSLNRLAPDVSVISTSMLSLKDSSTRSARGHLHLFHEEHFPHETESLSEQ